MNCFNIVINVILALGAIGTVGTFIVSLLQINKQNKKLNELEEKQLDARYRPDLRIVSYYGKVTEQIRLSITLKNQGENLKLLEFECEKDYLDKGNEHLPMDLDKDDIIAIMLKEGLKEIPNDFRMKIKVQDKIGRSFWVPLTNTSKGPIIVFDEILEILKR